MNEFNSQVCTSIEQSQRLLELGLKPETADMSYYILDSEPVLTIGMTQAYREIIKGGKIVEVQNAEIIPAWSLHRLMEIAGIDYVAFEGIKNAYDLYVKLIASYIKFGLLNKEYLKQ